MRCFWWLTFVLDPLNCRPCTFIHMFCHCFPFRPIRDRNFQKLALTVRIRGVKRLEAEGRTHIKAVHSETWRLVPDT